MLLGDYRVEIVSDAEFRLDGGAMFGVVPRVLWQKKCAPDELNRIKLQTNCLFVETPDEKILIETGIGEKWSEKEIEIYGIFREKPLAETLFEKTNCKPEDISIVVNTHLHFDHAGGNTALEGEIGRRGDGENLNFKSQISNSENQRPKIEDQRPIPQFPNARYFVSEAELKHAENPNQRDKVSYLAENWLCLKESGQLELKPKNYEIAAGLTMQTVSGHNRNMQTVRLKRGNKTIYGFADLIPTTAHLSPAWIMSYDLYPMETLENKKKLLKQAVEEDWICLFYHDFETPVCRLAETNGKITIKKTEIN